MGYHSAFSEGIRLLGTTVQNVVKNTSEGEYNESET